MFLGMGTLNDNREAFIAKCWSTPVITRSTYILTKKLQMLKDNKKLEQVCFG